MTTPVVFGGTYRSFRRALSPVVGLYNAAGVDPAVSDAWVSLRQLEATPDLFESFLLGA